jgi:hypothetical protein
MKAAISLPTPPIEHLEYELPPPTPEAEVVLFETGVGDSYILI